MDISPASIADKSVLGIDAAWTSRNNSGVALVVRDGGNWRLLACASSYREFMGDPDTEHWPDAKMPDAGALIAACRRFGPFKPELVAVDMPMARYPIAGRRPADDAVSREYGTRWCSTHTPSKDRPGGISDRLRADFHREGYPLATNWLAGACLIEVYPHPALIELTASERRLCYKVQKQRKYWKDASRQERLSNLIAVWSLIISSIEIHIAGISKWIPLPNCGEYVPVRDLKAFDDRLDAVICAWVGVCVLEDRARPLGDSDSAIWIPSGLALAGKRGVTGSDKVQDG
jgi:predicted RNase H-like nuclease